MSWYRRLQDRVRRIDISPDSPYHDQFLGPKEIRLIAFDPNKRRLHLTTTRYDLDNMPEYDAISYVWGTEEASVTIACNEGSLQITPHAYGMLKHLRRYRPAPTRLLWIDAICINQTDPDEKSVQIPLMHQLYSKSKSVVVWMGPAIPQTLAFMADFDRVKLIGREWVAMKSQDLDPRKDGPKLPVEDDPFWGGLFHLLNNEWFRRLWTFQEIILAPAGVIMLCGSSHINLDDFVEFVDGDNKGAYISFASLQANRIPGTPIWTDLAWIQCSTVKDCRASLVKEGQYINLSNIPTLVHMLRMHRVKEEVDRIWAISALLEEEVQWKLAPLVDYSDKGRAKYHDTYTRAAKVLVEHSQSLELLTIPPSVEVNAALPSWCPDLSGQAACSLKLDGWWNYSVNTRDQQDGLALTAEEDKEACDAQRAAIQHHPQKLISFADDDAILYVRGFVVDTVSEVIEDGLLLGKLEYINGDGSEMSFNNPTHVAAISFHTQALELARKTLSRSEGLADDHTNIVLEYLMALFTDTRISAQLETAYRDAFSVFTRCDWTHFLDLEISRQNLAMKSIGKLKHIVGHSFFATEGGRFGLAGPGCKPGDKVCVLYGGEPLHILRLPEEHSPGNRGHVKFCGIAFIPHLMEPHQSDAARLSEDEIFEIA